jgi:hypothetical protein
MIFQFSVLSVKIRDHPWFKSELLDLPVGGGDFTLEV